MRDEIDRTLTEYAIERERSQWNKLFDHMRSNRMLYEMTEDQLSTLLVHCAPTPVMLVGGVNIGASAEENANRAWARLGKVMGFKPMSVRPVPGRGYRFFTATPVEKEGKE